MPSAAGSAKRRDRRTRDRGLRFRLRPALLAGLIVFLAISALLARWLALENVERSAVLVVLQAQARGDAAAMLEHLHPCSSSCRADAIADARRLKRPGQIQILAYQSATAYSVTTSVGFTRVAWKSSVGRLPVVQCVKVERKGNALSGISILLLGVSQPIPDTSDC
jgi:hypothetical protein